MCGYCRLSSEESRSLLLLALTLRGWRTAGGNEELRNYAGCLYGIVHNEHLHLIKLLGVHCSSCLIGIELVNSM